MLKAKKSDSIFMHLPEHAINVFFKFCLGASFQSPAVAEGEKQ